MPARRTETKVPSPNNGRTGERAGTGIDQLRWEGSSWRRDVHSEADNRQRADAGRYEGAERPVYERRREALVVGDTEMVGNCWNRGLDDADPARRPAGSTRTPPRP